MPKKETVEVVVGAGEQAKIFTTKHCDPIGYYTVTSLFYQHERLRV